jgi:hypothetical protein
MPVSLMLSASTNIHDLGRDAFGSDRLVETRNRDSEGTALSRDCISDQCNCSARVRESDGDDINLLVQGKCLLR